MPSIPPRPNQRTLYPDTSTLSYAFAGHDLSAPSEQRELTSLIQDVARTANLCLSFAHIIEFVLNVDKDEGLARAHWLDTLEVVWMHDLQAALDLEVEHFLRKAAGLSAETVQLPAAPSLLATFPGVTPEQLSHMVSDCTVTRLVETAGHDLDTRHRLNSLSALGPNYNRRLFFDRKQALLELTKKELHSALKAKVDQQLLEDALEANRRLVERDLNYRIKSGSLWVAPDEEFVRSVMRPHADAPKELPLVFAFQEVLRNVGSELALKEDINMNFFTSKNREGDVFDWWHLVGAAYCDAFACDKYTSRCLVDVRKRIGRSKEVVFRGGDYSCLARDLRTAMQT
jgi:hypothetical protein